MTLALPPKKLWRINLTPAGVAFARSHGKVWNARHPITMFGSTNIEAVNLFVESIEKSHGLTLDGAQHVTATLTGGYR